ncbi:Mitotic spindle-associated MMXD complex subunit MIP18 [Branchiostoma belcheri]|nr:Mitotic spindle-associated MMXD complex subunit MIP18 [Branchiostoma belcheri]
MSSQERLQNANPQLYGRTSEREVTPEELDDDVEDKIDAREIFDILSWHRELVDEDNNNVSVEFTPTIPHCSMATLIGLSIRVKLLRALPTRFKVDVHITPGTHQSELAVNKQLADKERVAAALENQHLLEVVNQCLSTRN